MGSCLRGAEEWWHSRPLWVVPIAVFGILPLAIIVDSTEASCAYVLLVMAVLWLTETLPISATALLPVFMFPMAGVQKASDVSRNYLKDTSMLFIGGLMLAVAVEEWNLHRRIALGVLRIVGTNPMWLMLGMMLPTWFLSMWISNTATASMMIPIVAAVLLELKPAESGEVNEAFEPEGEVEVDLQMEEVKVVGNSKTNQDKTVQRFQGSVVSSPHDGIPGEAANREYRVSEATEEQVQEKSGSKLSGSPEYQRLCKGMSLCIAYAANVGGIATLTGTPPNLVFQGQVKDLYKKHGLETDVTFASWMVLALPLSAITLVFAWIWLVILFVRGGCLHRDKKAAAGVKKTIARQFKEMGRLSLAEGTLIVLFVLLALMWLTRDFKTSPGWGSWFQKGYVSDSTPAILVAVLLFILPARLPSFCGGNNSADPDCVRTYAPLLTWDMVHKKMPWGVIILLGGGFALADACKESGLSAWLGGELSSFRNFEPWVLNLILCSIVAVATEVTSNTATATLLLPILAELAIQIGVNPLYLMASGAIATSFAFIMPVATPPNAIVFSHGYLRISDMAIAGFVMNIVAVLCLTLAVNTWGDAFFNFSTLPDAFRNGTIAA